MACVLRWGLMLKSALTFLSLRKISIMFIFLASESWGSDYFRFLRDFISIIFHLGQFSNEGFLFLAHLNTSMANGKTF